MRIPWFHDRRAEIEREPLPTEWREWLQRNVRHYSHLTPGEQFVLEVDMRLFREQKEWEAGGDGTVDDEMKVTISAEACLLLLGRKDHGWFPNVRSIIVYPSGYRAATQSRVLGGVQEVAVQERLGEAWGHDFPIILSWNDALRGASGHGHGENVCLHEFAHKLDFRSGTGDGVPPLANQRQSDRWANVMSARYDELVYATEHGRQSVLNPYGATNPAEFFAVATETFFERPATLRDELPDLYEVLLGFYAIDWAERLPDS